MFAEPTTSIFGGPDIHVHEGSPVNLSCVVSQAVGQPEFFFWYHNGQVILLEFALHLVRTPPPPHLVCHHYKGVHPSRRKNTQRVLPQKGIIATKTSFSSSSSFRQVSHSLAPRIRVQCTIERSFFTPSLLCPL